MSRVLVTLMLAIGACYALGWGYGFIVKRQRIDWPHEREQFKQQLKMMYRIMQRLMQLYWRGWGSK